MKRIEVKLSLPVVAPLLDVIKVLALAMLCLIPLVFLMKRPPKSKGAAPMH
jgi:hypothetical protein